MDILSVLRQVPSTWGEGVGDIYRGWQRSEHARNEHLRIIRQLRDNGVAPFDALHLANLLAYHPDTPETELKVLQMMKALGYVSHQAQ